MATKGGEIPKELKQHLKGFDNALTEVENEFEPFMKKSQIEINAELSTLDKAKLDLVSAYTINSLFWMYLNVNGINPKDHAIKQELDRIRSYMNRVKDIQEAEQAKKRKMKVNVPGAKRVIKSALWEAAKKQIEVPYTKGDSSIEGTIQEHAHSSDQQQGGKRKSEGDDRNEGKIKKKKNKKNRNNR